MTLPQAVAFGDPETIRMVWDRSDEKERVSNPALIRIAIDFHHVEVARWLLQEQPLWVGLGRLFARGTQAFDVLSRLPQGSGELPTLDDASSVERNPKFDSAVADAVETESMSWLTAALLAGGNPSGKATDPLDGTFLCLAARSGHEDVVRLLLQFGASPTCERWDEINPLAEGAAHPRIVALLLEKGANPNDGWADGFPLVCAAHSRSIESLRLLLAHGGDARQKDVYGDNVLHWALDSTNAECCRELLTHGADPCGCNKWEYETPMHVVARRACDYDDGPERVKILDLLLDAGASMLAIDEDDCTPGQTARRCGASKEVLEWFARHEVV
jgi:ankyrin repeat protein